jgi:hypothetical protein
MYEYVSPPKRTISESFAAVIAPLLSIWVLKTRRLRLYMLTTDFGKSPKVLDSFVTQATQ